MKIVTVVGARPQFIKASALSREIRRYEDIEEIIIHTGQHFDSNMSNIFFEEMDIPKPKYQLDIHSLSHGAMTGRMMEGIENILLDEKPDFTLVYGDTNSTLAGALAARKLNIKVVHVEAGLRSFNMEMPEEINRILTDRISDILFCPTKTAVHNLQNEAYDRFGIKIIQCGDIMLDAAIFYKAKADRESSIIKDMNLVNKEYVLATLHRQENTDDAERLFQIVDALNTIHQHRTVVLPIHPRTRKLLEKYKIAVQFKLIEPVGYLDMLSLTSNSSLVMTDSGGLQKEAFFLNKYCITLRNQTEWVELVEGKYNFLAGADRTSILNIYNSIPKYPASFDSSLYGDGQAAKKIIEALLLL